MGVLDLFKATENANLKQENAKLKELLNPDQKKVFDLNIEIEKLESTKKNILKDIDKLSTKCNILETEIQSKKSQLIELDDDILYQSFSLYKPLYDFATSEQYFDIYERLNTRNYKLLKTILLLIKKDNILPDQSLYVI